MGNLASACSSSLSSQEYSVISALTTFRVASVRQLQSVTDVLDIVSCLESLLTQNVISKVERHGVVCYTLVPGALDSSLPDQVVPAAPKVSSLRVGMAQVLTIKPKINLSSTEAQVSACIAAAKDQAKRRHETWTEEAILGFFYVSFGTWMGWKDNIAGRLATRHAVNAASVKTLVKKFGIAGARTAVSECFTGRLKWLDKDERLPGKLIRENIAFRVEAAIRQAAEVVGVGANEQSTWTRDVSDTPVTRDRSIRKK